MKRNYFLIFSVLVLASSLLNVGAMLKKDGAHEAILNTQTDPITHKAKTEELKEGPKGAPTPSFKYYGSEQILTKLPVGEYERETDLGSERRDKIPNAGDSIPENLEGIKEVEEEELEDSWWFEEWSDLEAESEEREEKSDDFSM